MSFLFPLYFLGLAALSIPLFLHLRNRDLKNVTHFSSLMFLQPTPIQHRQRSKLENLLLLLLRCLILALLATAFARPFFKQDVFKTFAGTSKEVVILIDTSASMQREDLWEAAMTEIEGLVDELDETDQVQVMTFAGSPRIIQGFESWRETDEAERKSMLLTKLELIEPSWEATRLGDGLVAAAEAFRDAREESEEEFHRDRKVYLVSDLQQGADAEALSQFSWPLDIECIPITIGTSGDNGALQLIPKATGIAELQEQEDQFRLFNSRDSRKREFLVQWKNEDGSPAGAAQAYQVDPGESQIFVAPKTTSGIPAPILELSGDEEGFDNRYYRSPPIRKPLRIVYFGDEDPNQASAPLYFFQRALIETETFKPDLLHKRFGDSLDALDWSLVDFVVLSSPPGQVNLDPFREYLDNGGRALFLMRDTNAASGLARLLGSDSLPAEEVNPSDYALLGKLDRKHPYLQGFAEARFADFTKIHFWKYRKLNPSDFPEAKVIGQFVSGDPAWLEVSHGKGQLLVFTSSWDKADSQLALSTKFVPLLYAILTEDPNAQDTKRSFLVGDPLPLDPQGEKTITKPDSTTVTVAEGEEIFREADLPGLYRIERENESLTVAVNLDSAESITAASDPDRLQQLLKLEREGDAAVAPELQAARAGKVSIEEQESRQKVWWWLLLAVLILVFLEILYSARCAQPKPAVETA